MNIWIVFVGETLPMDKDSRTWRYGMLAEALAERGHTVVRWAPTFNHSYKKQRDIKNNELEVNNNYIIRLLYNNSYQKNISIKRFYSYRIFSKNLKQHFDSVADPPDCILVGLPSPDVCNVAIEYAKKNAIPICLDIRDIWPDIFFMKFHKFLQGIAQFIFRLICYDIKKIIRSADVLFAVSDSYLNWGLRKAERKAGYYDKSFPIGYNLMPTASSGKDKEIDLLKRYKIDSTLFSCCYFGQLEETYDIETILEVASLLTKYDKIQFIICGRGKKEKLVQEVAMRKSNVFYLGWVSQSVLDQLMKIAHLGLASYAQDAPQSLPNKPFEYLSGGLPIASSLRGELSKILRENNCGFLYDAGCPEQLAQGIINLYNQPKKQLIMSKNAKKLFDTSFSADRIYSSMVEHIEKIVNQKK